MNAVYKMVLSRFNFLLKLEFVKPVMNVKCHFQFLPILDNMDPSRELPRTQVKRIVKTKLNDLFQSQTTQRRNANISKEALTGFAECGRVFISYITDAANDVCRDAKRSTVTGDDVLQALRNVAFEEFIEPLTSQLEGTVLPPTPLTFFVEFRAEVKEKNRKKAINRQLKEAENEKEPQSAEDKDETSKDGPFSVATTIAMKQADPDDA